MVGHGHGIGHSLEVVETVLKVADVAWGAIEHHRHASSHDHHPEASEGGYGCCEETEALKSENLRLRSVLRENLALLQQISQSPNFALDCPTDVPLGYYFDSAHALLHHSISPELRTIKMRKFCGLYTQLVATVNSLSFSTQLESLQEKSKDSNNSFPFTKPTGADLHLIEVMVSGHQGQPSMWVWVTEEMVPSNTEEFSGIDNENYVIINEELVVDGVANFIARCVLSNPKSKNLTPAELQKTVAKALGEMNKLEKMKKLWHAAQLFYAISTWGIALAGLYRHRAVLKAVARGVHASSKVIISNAF